MRIGVSVLLISHGLSLNKKLTTVKNRRDHFQPYLKILLSVHKVKEKIDKTANSIAHSLKTVTKSVKLKFTTIFRIMSFSVTRKLFTTT
jgi:hypothetical protein